MGTVFGAIGAVIIGVSCWRDLGGFVAICITVGEFLICWFSSWLMYGVGELNDNPDSMKMVLAIEKLHKLEKQIGEMENSMAISAASSKEIEKQIKELQKYMAAAAPDGQSTVHAEPAPSETVPEGMWRCRRCGSLNELTDSSCKYCGAAK